MSGSYISSIPNKPNSPFALLKLTSTSSNCENTSLSHDCLEYLITESRTKIGRRTEHLSIDVRLTDSRAISPIHLEFWRIKKESIYSFLVQVIGRNGVYMNSTFIPPSDGFIQLMPRAIFQFPGTDYRLEFLSNIGPVVDKLDKLAEGECQQAEEPETKIPSQQIATDYIENNRQEESQLKVATETIFDDNLFPVSSESVMEENHSLDTFMHNPKLCDIINGTARLPEGTDNTITSQEPISDFPNEPLKAMVKDVLNDTNINCPPAINIPKIPAKRQKRTPGNNKKKAKTEPEMVDMKNVSIEPAEEVKHEEPVGTSERPPFTYLNLVMQAIYYSPNQQLTLSEIYEWIKTNYPFFRTAGNSWKNSVRYNLSSKMEFAKVNPSGLEGCNNTYWRIAPNVKMTISNDKIFVPLKNQSTD